MRCRFSLLVLGIYASFLAGCGGSASPPASSISYPNLTGNWNIFLVPANPAVSSHLLGGYLANINGSVSGTLHLFESNCYSIAQDVAITGAVTSEGGILFTSAAVAGQTLDLAGISEPAQAQALYPDFLSGTYTIAGGCASGENGTVVGNVVPPFSGSYTGTFESVSGLSIGVSATLAQGGPNSDGEFSVSGPVTFTGSPCFKSGTITSSIIFGDYVDVTITDNSSGTMEFTGLTFGSAEIAPPPSILGGYRVTAGACMGDTGSGALSSS